MLRQTILSMTISFLNSWFLICFSAATSRNILASPGLRAEVWQVKRDLTLIPSKIHISSPIVSCPRVILGICTHFQETSQTSPCPSHGCARPQGYVLGAFSLSQDWKHNGDLLLGSKLICFFGWEKYSATPMNVVFVPLFLFSHLNVRSLSWVLHT